MSKYYCVIDESDMLVAVGATRSEAVQKASGFVPQDRTVSARYASEGACCLACTSALAAAFEKGRKDSEFVPFAVDPIKNLAMTVREGRGAARAETGRMFKWVVEIEVSELWVTDGFDLDENRCLKLAGDLLPYANLDGSEVKVRVKSAPNRVSIARAQGASKEELDRMRTEESSLRGEEEAPVEE